MSLHNAKGEQKGTVFSPGIHGEPNGSIEVQGRSDSYIELKKDAGNLNIKYSISILLYVYPMGSPGPIVNYKKDGHGVQIYESKYPRDSQTLAARVNERSKLGRTKVVQKIGILTRNQWHFIGMTYNYSSGLVKLWHNGHQVAFQNIGTIQIATQFDVRIGARQITNQFFRGRVACLQFYNTALTQRQIEKARIACKPCKYTVQPTGVLLFPLWEVLPYCRSQRCCTCQGGRDTSQYPRTLRYPRTIPQYSRMTRSIPIRPRLRTVPHFSQG